MKSNMENEIFAQNSVIEHIKSLYTTSGKINFDIDKNFKRVKFIASGSSYNAARLGCKFFESLNKKSVSFEYSSEFISNTNRNINNETLYCFISQSGETFDTKEALKLVKEKNARTLAIVNNSNSTIYNEADFKIDVSSGVEYSIAATKSFLATVVCCYLLALYFGDKNVENELDEAIGAIQDSLKIKLDDICLFLSKKKKFSIIGYNFAYILAKEGALKIKETSYIDVSAYPTGEFLHGHSALLNKTKTLIEIYTKGLSAFEKNTLTKIKNDFHPDIVTISDEKGSKKSIVFKNYKSDIAKICAITVILQLIALKIALIKGFDVDKPVGLSKIVR